MQLFQRRVFDCGFSFRLIVPVWEGGIAAAWVVCLRALVFCLFRPPLTLINQTGLRDCWEWRPYGGKEMESALALSKVLIRPQSTLFITLFVIIMHIPIRHHCNGVHSPLIYSLLALFIYLFIFFIVTKSCQQKSAWCQSKCGLNSKWLVEHV